MYIPLAGITRQNKSAMQCFNIKLTKSFIIYGYYLLYCFTLFLTIYKFISKISMFIL